jgi:hypothetical protein
MKLSNMILKQGVSASAFATCAHMMMDMGTVEPWPYLGVHWWARTLKGAVGLWLGLVFWEVLKMSFKNGNNGEATGD